MKCWGSLESTVTFLIKLARELLSEDAGTANNDDTHDPPAISRSRATGGIFFAEEAREPRLDHFRPLDRY
jgi:hypothetical protein